MAHLKSAYIEDGIEKVDLADTDGKKNVFLIGDSIREGYCGIVKNLLQSNANVYYPSENCRSTQYILVSLSNWAVGCSDDKIDLVYFNAGHWDIAHWEGEEYSLTPVEEYKRNIGRIILRLKKRFPNAKIYYATTTPMNPSGAMGRNPRYNYEIEKYNQAAKDEIINHGVLFDDLYSLMADKDEEYYFDYCHFNKKGFTYIAEHITQLIVNELDI